MFRHIALHLSLGAALLMPAMKPVAAVSTGTTASDSPEASSVTIRSGYIVASS